MSDDNKEGTKDINLNASQLNKIPTKSVGNDDDNSTQNDSINDNEFDDELGNELNKQLNNEQSNQILKRKSKPMYASTEQVLLLSDKSRESNNNIDEQNSNIVEMGKIEEQKVDSNISADIPDIYKTKYKRKGIIVSNMDPRDVQPWDETFYHKNLGTFRQAFDNIDNLLEFGEDKQHLNEHKNDLDNLFIDPNSKDMANSSGMELKQDEDELNENEQELEDKKTEGTKFGWFVGVFCRCLLNIFGVIMFLRVGWITGQAGIILTLVIMGVSAIVTTLTTLSMSALCTNGTIKGGGAYYIISRSLGPAVGGSVGVMFSFGNMISVSMYLIGFAETLVQDLSETGFSITDNPINDVRIWSNVVLVFCLFLALVGLKLVVKANLFLLIFIALAIILFFVGSFYRTKFVDISTGMDLPSTHPNATQVIFGVDGWVNGNFRDNLGPSFSEDETGKKHNFWTVLGIYFPAVTGIMAGANISGELVNPSVDIPKGTLWAVFFSTIIYMLLATVAGAVTLRWELLNNYLVMADICVSKWFVTIGIYAASLSSGIASLVGAPRILMAIAQDQIVPGLSIFGVASKSGEPYRGYFLSFIIAGLCNCIGQLNAVAPLITQFFMIAYLLLNFACLAMEMSKTPGWRPSFKYFNRYTSGLGALLCLVFMFLLDYRYALLAVVVAVGLYLYIEWKGINKNWGPAQESRQFYRIYKGLLNLARIQNNVKNWRPSFLILVKNPKTEPQLILFSQTLRKSYSPLFFLRIDIQNDYRINLKRFRELNNNGYLPYLGMKKKHKGFYHCVFADSLRTGASNAMQFTGIGTMRPNTLMLMFKRKWQKNSNDQLVEYIQILRDALLMRYGVMICCSFETVNWNVKYYTPPAKELISEDHQDYQWMYATQPGTTLKPIQSGITNDTSDMDSDDSDNGDNRINTESVVSGESQGLLMDQTSEWAVGQGLKQYIDVYWLAQDGGFPILLPHILTRDTFWKNCLVRINVIVYVNELDAHGIDSYTQAQKLIKAMRFKYQTPRKLEIPSRGCQPSTIKLYEKLSNEKIKDTLNPSVTKRWLKLCEILWKYSRFSALNIVTLPLPEKKLSPRAYMALLYMLSDKQRLPPTIFVRGNGESSLTFESE